MHPPSRLRTSPCRGWSNLPSILLPSLRFLIVAPPKVHCNVSHFTLRLRNCIILARAFNFCPSVDQACREQRRALGALCTACVGRGGAKFLDSTRWLAVTACPYR